MDKKEFFEPEVRVVVLDDAQIICMSGGKDDLVGGDGDQTAD